MPSISFCFQGWVSMADVTEALEVATGETVNISHIDSETLVKRLEDGELALSLDEALSNCDKSECEIHDYEVHE